MFDFTPFDSTINAAAYQKTRNNSETLFGKRDPDFLPQEFFFGATMLDLSVLSQL